MKLSPSQISIINGIITIPWIIKPIWGYISDTVPIFGFRRKVYLIFLGILQCLFWIFLSFFGFNPIFVAFLLLIDFFSQVLSRTKIKDYIAII